MEELIIIPNYLPPFYFQGYVIKAPDEGCIAGASTLPFMRRISSHTLA